MYTNFLNLNPWWKSIIISNHGSNSLDLEKDENMLIIFEEDAKALRKAMNWEIFDSEKLCKTMYHIYISFKNIELLE